MTPVVREYNVIPNQCACNFFELRSRARARLQTCLEMAVRARQARVGGTPWSGRTTTSTK